MKAFKAKGGDVSWHIHDERSLLALQVNPRFLFPFSPMSKVFDLNFIIFLPWNMHVSCCNFHDVFFPLWLLSVVPMYV